MPSPSSPRPVVTDAPSGPVRDARAWQHALWIVAGSTLLRLAFAAGMPLFPDEAYYWDWSRRLAAGYFDHPPAIAWCIAAGTALFGDAPFAIRLVPVLLGGSGALALVLAARHLAGDHAARFTAAAFAVMPLAVAGLVLATPDAPLLAALAWTLWCTVRALGAPARSAAATRWWVAAGVCIGLAMASKFTGVFVPMALLLAFALHAPLRARFAEPGPWIAVAVASLIMLPVLRWNADHQWIAFRFQLGHGLGTNAREPLWQRELNLVASQFALVSPVLFVLVLGAVRDGLRAVRVRGASRAESASAIPPAVPALAVIAAFCLLFFVYSATRRNVEANWPGIAWLPALVLLGAARPGARTAWERRALWVAGALSAVLLLHVAFRILPLPARRDQVSQAHGWEGLALSVDSARRAISANTRAADAEAGRPADRHALHLAANRYQDAALLSYHMPLGDSLTALNLGARRNQYDVWPRLQERARPGDDLLLVLEMPREGLPGPIRRLTMHFRTIRPGPIVPLLRDGEPVARRQLWLLSGWDGSWPADSTDLLRPRP